MDATTQASSPERLAKLREAAAVCLGMRVSGAVLRNGKVLGIDLDRLTDRQVGSGPERMRLRVYTPAWRLDSSERVLAASGDEPDFVGAALHGLVGQTATAVEVAYPSADTTIVFETCRLRVFPVYFGDDESAVNWTLQPVPGRRLLAAGPGSSWSVKVRRAAAGKEGER